MRRVSVIATGGTIEKVYSEQTGTVQNVEGKVERYFGSLRLPDTEIDLLHLMNKDSLEMTGEDRLKVLEAVRTSLEQSDGVVITHGTDTLVQTGMLLKERIADPRCAIVMTGAMTPLGFEGSDGLQNLTEALLAARLLQPGVWLVIHGQVFPINRVRKNRERARFEWSSEYEASRGSEIGHI